MNGEIPQIPITTLSGLTSLTELLPHLPLPGPLDDAESSHSGPGGPPLPSLLFNKKFEDEAGRLLSKTDPGLASQLAQALASTSSESLRLLSHIPGVDPVDNDPNNIPRSSIPLLKQILLANSMTFKGKNRDFPKKHPEHQQQSRKIPEEVIIDDDDDDDNDDGVNDKNFNSRAPNWSKTNGKVGHRHNQEVTTTLMNGGSSPEYVSRPTHESRNHHHPHHQHHQTHPQNHHQYPSRPYNSHAKGSPLQASSAPQVLDKGRSGYPEMANQGAWGNRGGFAPPSGHHAKPPVTTDHASFLQQTTSLSAIPTKYLTNQKASNSQKHRQQSRRLPWDSWSRTSEGTLRVPPTLAHGGSFEFPKVHLEAMNEDDVYNFDFGSRKHRQATTAKWLRHSDRMKRRHEFFVDELGNRKRRRLGSEDPEGESEADREKRKRHKERARQRMEAEEDLMQSPMYQRFMTIIAGIMDAFEEAAQTINLEEEDDDQDECPAELLISQEKLADLCAEVAKLKASKGLHLVSMDRIVRVLSALERNVRDASRLTPYLEEEAEGAMVGGEEDKMWRDVVMERVLRSADAGLAALNIMCAPKMPKQVFVEDVIERCVKYSKFQLQNTIYPDYDPVYRTNNKGSSTMKQKRAKAAIVKNKHSINLYNKMTQTIKLLAELSDQSELTDTIVLQISSLGVSAFFVENIPELQLNAIQLVTAIFSRYPKHRQLILDDILSSLARLPSSKKSLRNYKINSEDSIQMMSGLVLQLMQSVVQLPEVSDESAVPDEDVDEEELRRRRKRKVDNDVFVEQSYTQALQVAHNFLARFLQKCGMKGEEDFRPLFENFVQDLLTAVNKPEWPAAEVMLWLLGSLLISQFGNKSIDMSLRISSIDYLGIIASRLRKDALHSNVNQRAIRALMEILSVTDDPNFDDEVKAEEELAAKEGKKEDDDDDDDKDDKDVVKRKSRINVKSMEESGSDSSTEDEDEDEGISDDDDDENFDGDDVDENGIEKKRKKTPKKKKKKKKKDSSTKKEVSKGGKDSQKGTNDGDRESGDHNLDSKVKNNRSELRTNALQMGLLAYLRAQGESGDPTYSHAQRFYLAQWFKDAQDEAKVALANKNKSAKKVRDEINVNSDDDEEVVAAEKANHQEEIEELEKHTQMLTECDERKQRMLSMAAEFVKGRPSWDRSKLDYKDASLATCYLSTQRTFGQSFELYLKKILRVLGESAIAVRTKAMKCLAAVVEVDPSLLERVDMQQGVQARFLDQANSVREAAVDLIGRFIIMRPSLTEKYYPMIMERILDTGVSVRKRVIKILRDICIEQPEFSKNTEICVRMIRRVHDEEGIKKLVSEVFENMWFTPVTPKGRAFGTKDSELKAQVKAKITIKILQLTDVVHACTAEAGGAAGLEWLEALVASLLKREEDANDEALAAALLAAPGGANNKKPPRDPTSTTLAREELIQNYHSNVGPVLKACQQLVDALIDHVIQLDYEISSAPIETTTREHHDDDDENESPGKKEKVNGFKDSDESDESKEDIKIEEAKPSETRLKTAKLISSFSSLNLFTRVKPMLMNTHAITLAPYLESFDADTTADNAVINDVTSILEDVIPIMEHPSENFLSDVEERLMKNVFRRPQSVIPSSVSCLAALVNHVTHNFKFIKDSLMNIYNELKNGAKKLTDREPGMEEKLPKLRRNLFTLGLFCKHFSFSDLGFPDNTEERILNTFLYYIRNKAVRDEELKARALDGVGFFCSTHYKLMLGKQIRDLYSSFLTKPGLDLVRSKLQVLRNMQSYLQEEENRQTKEERAYKKKLKEELLAREAGMSKKVEGADSLKEMNDIQAGMASTIIQVYIKEINMCFHSAYKPIRLCALEVLCLILNQGLIHPVQSVPYLISAATDQDHTIAVKSEKQLADIDQKYPGFIQMKALQGVRLSYDLQVLHKRILQATTHEKSKTIILRGLRVDANSGNASACLAPVYNHLRGNKAHRRAFLTSLMYLFEDSSTALLQEKIYICDNLAYFPYQQQYEPLFMIHQIDLIVSVSGANLLQAFKELLRPKPGEEEENGLTNGAEAPKTNGELQKTREELEQEEKAWQERERELESCGEFDKLEEEREARERRKRAAEEERRRKETKLAYDDEDDDLELLASRIPDHAEQLFAIYHSWQGCVLLLILKQFLKDYYGITEARIQSYSPQDGSKGNDKPLNRRQGVDRFNPGPALAILQKGDPEYPLSDDAKEDLANEYSRFKNLMLQLDPTDEQEIDPEAPDDPGRLQKTSANAFKEYMAGRADRVDPNVGVQTFTRPADVGPGGGGPQQDGGVHNQTILASTSGTEFHNNPGGAFARHLGHAHHQNPDHHRPTTPSGSSATRGSTPSKGTPSSKRKRSSHHVTPAKKHHHQPHHQKKKKKRRKIVSDSEDDASSEDNSDDPSWE